MTEPRAERPAMADYDVPADDLDGVLPWSWAEERLVASRNLWVMSAYPDGRPHAMPVWGVWYPPDSTFVFSCGENSRKAKNFAVNPNATVAVDSTVEVVVVEGTVRTVKGEEVAAAIDAYVEKYWSDSPQEREEGREFMLANQVMALTPRRAFGIIETPEDFSRRATRWVW